MAVETSGVYHYFISFIDDFSRFTCVSLLKQKSDATETISIIITAAEKVNTHTVQQFQSDDEGEYVNSCLQNLFTEKGIKHETSVAHSYESNGVTKCFKCTILELLRTVGVNSKFPRNLLGQAVAMLTHVKNLLPHSTLLNQLLSQPILAKNQRFRTFAILEKQLSYSSCQKLANHAPNSAQEQTKEKYASLAIIKKSIGSTF